MGGKGGGGGEGEGEGEGSEVVWVGWLMQKGSKASFYRL